jgi:SAM-dependent methyltransferase
MGCGPGHVARYLHEAGTRVFGLDLSPRMIENARKLSPDLVFRVGNMMDLDLAGASLAGIAAFYSIVNFPKRIPDLVFREMDRVLRPGGQLFLAFHIADRVTEEDALGSHPISMDFFFFQPAEIQRQLELAGFAIEDIIEREPYPDVEYQSRRAYIFARKVSPALLGSSAMT